jgi:transcriptional regulator with XRE-family HTH domain
MEDLARGERIKALREERHLKQPAVIDLLERKVGAKVVGLRGYQLWEAGGGIKWENVTLLADVFGVEPEWIMTGAERHTPPTPDLAGSLNGDSRSQTEQLDRIETLLRENQQIMLALAAGLRTETPVRGGPPWAALDRLREELAARDRQASQSAPPQRKTSTG